MQKKHYSLGADARKDITEVAEQVGNIIGKTLGKGGRNYFIPQGITNDGRTILSQIRFDNECKDNVSLAFEEVAARQDAGAGDGTTTATVVSTELTKNILSEVQDLDVPVPGTKPVMSLSSQLEEEKTKALEFLDKKRIPVDTKEQLYNVAFTAMENEQGAQIISDGIWEGGKETLPVLEEGCNKKIEKDTINGVRFNFQAASDDTFNKNDSAEYENVAVLVVNHAFEQYLELAPYLGQLVQAKAQVNALVIVANHFSIPFISKVSETNSAGKFKIILAARQNAHNEEYEDAASYVNANFLDTHPKTGNKITDLKLNDAGRAQKVILRRNEIIFIGGQGEESVMDDKDGFNTRLGARVKELEGRLETVRDSKEKEEIETRLAHLKGGITTIYVDAESAVERYYTHLKAEDAMNSCRFALREGMLPGAGVTLKEIAEELGEDALLYKALCEPYRRIELNHGGAVDTEGIFDSYQTIKSVIESSISVVKVLVTTEGIVANVEKSMVEELKTKLFNE